MNHSEYGGRPKVCFTSSILINAKKDITSMACLLGRFESPINICRLTIDVTYCCTDGDGFAVREDFVVEAFFERPLMQSVQEVLPERLHQSLQKGTLHCYEGHKNASCPVN